MWKANQPPDQPITRRAFFGEAGKTAVALLSMSMLDLGIFSNPVEAQENNFSYLNKNGQLFKFPFQNVNRENLNGFEEYFEKPKSLAEVTGNVARDARGHANPDTKFENKRDRLYFLIWNTYREAKHTMYDPKYRVQLQEIQTHSLELAEALKKGCLSPQQKQAFLVHQNTLENQRQDILAKIRMENLINKNEIDAERLAIALAVLDRMLSTDNRFFPDVGEVVFEGGQFSWVDFDKKFPSPKKVDSQPEDINLVAFQETCKLIGSFFIEGLSLREIREDIVKEIEKLLSKRAGGPAKVPKQITNYDKTEMTKVEMAGEPDYGRAGPQTIARLKKETAEMKKDKSSYIIINAHTFRSHTLASR